MNKLDSNYQPLTLTSASVSDLQPVRHLLVLVPHSDFDLALLARKVWELANASGSHVQFLGLHSDAAQEPKLRRDLVTLSAMVKDDKVYSEIEVVFGKDWGKVIEERYHTGDMIVCFAEQRTGLLKQSLSDLQIQLNIPIYILSDSYLRKNSQPSWLSQLALWSGLLAIIAGFFMLQVRIEKLPKDTLYYVLFLLTLPIELWTIVFWNNLFE